MKMLEWAQAWEGDRTVAKTRVDFVQSGSRQKVYVSTVWLGLDHSYFPGSDPLIFETMVFNGPLDQEMMRYSTEEQARKGHGDMVLRVRAVGPGPDRYS